MWQGASVGSCKFRSGRLGGCSQCWYIVLYAAAQRNQWPIRRFQRQMHGTGSLSQDKERCSTIYSSTERLWSMPHAVTPHSADAHLTSSACIGQRVNLEVFVRLAFRRPGHADTRAPLVRSIHNTVFEKARFMSGGMRSSAHSKRQLRFDFAYAD